MSTWAKYENLLVSPEVQQDYFLMRKNSFENLALARRAREHRDRTMVRRKEEDKNEFYLRVVKSNDY